MNVDLPAPFEPTIRSRRFTGSRRSLPLRQAASRVAVQPYRAAAWLVPHNCAVLDRHRGDSSRGQHCSVVVVGYASLDRCGDFGVEHDTFFIGQVAGVDVAREGGFDLAAGNAVLAGNRPPDPGPMVELLFG